MLFELHDEFSKITDLMKKVLRKTQHSEDSTHLSNKIEHINSNFLLLFFEKRLKRQYFCQSSSKFKILEHRKIQFLCLTT